MIKLEEIKSLYFIGIGGIGMSALARYFKQRGAKVSGYDKTESNLTKKLVKEGIDIHYKDDPKQIPADAEMVIYTPAVPGHLAELQYARDRSIPLYKRAQVLGMLSRGKQCIAIAGTHGKTTTAAIVTHLLRSGGIDATAFVGGLAHNLPKQNFVAGDSDWIVVEADEYDRSFLQLSPELAVITSVDADHLDIYGDANQMKESGFEAFAARISDTLFVREGIEMKLPDTASALSFGVESGDCRSENVRIQGARFSFDYSDENGRISNISWSMPGRHNIENATAAIAIARKLGIENRYILEGLSTFKGIWRRADWIIQKDEVTFIDDYAHHPTELIAIIEAVRELLPGKKLTAVFQPHLYSRTRDHAYGFAKALELVDVAILLPIYPARELPIKGISSTSIYNEIQNTEKYIFTNKELLQFIQKEKPQHFMTLGAGDIDRLVPTVKELMENY